MCGLFQCIPCSDNSICSLVLLLFVFNTLTMATGYLNGLIFYANIVQYNRLILFPHDRHTGPLTVFISWINLDLGIQTCFYNGMDTYANTWLQFVFPKYIWIIVVAIVIASKYSSRVAKLYSRKECCPCPCHTWTSQLFKNYSHFHQCCLLHPYSSL